MKRFRKLAFVHNGPLYFDQSTESYFGISFSSKLVERYSFLADEVIFVMRKVSLGQAQENRLSKIDAHNFTFLEVPNHLTFKTFFFNKQRRRIMSKAVQNADMVVARIPSGNGFLAIELAKRYKKPYMIEAVSCPFDALWNSGWKGKLLTPLIVWRMRQACAGASHVAYVTEQFLQKRYPSKGKVVSLSNVELSSSFSHEILINRIRRIRHLELCKFTIGTLGGIDVPYKGHKYVLKAIATLKDSGINLHYRIAGGGKGEALKRQATMLGISSQVTFDGLIPHERIGEWFDKIDMYVHPSDQEGLPRALLEAMSFALPVIGSSTGGIPELLHEKMVFSRKNVSDLIRRIKKCTPDSLADAAVGNFEKAKAFRSDLLEKKRRKFYESFLKYHGM